MSAEDVAQLKLLTIGDSGMFICITVHTSHQTIYNFYLSPGDVGKGVGKTWLLLRWAGVAGKLSTFSSSMPTIGIDFKMKTTVVHGRRLKVQVVSC